LTADERIVLAPVHLPIFHPYSDAPDNDITVQTYAYEEAFGEKVRALAERTRPRDLYDVINLYRNMDALSTPSVLLDVLRQKCDFKGIAVPRAADLDPFKDALVAGWEHMLRHQLPALPPVESFWDVLSEFFAWLETGIAPEIPASFVSLPGERVLRERTLRLPVRPVLQAHLEVIRFAAANRLCVDLDYQGRMRRIEPYSLRLTRDENIILHAWNVDKDEHRSYRVDRIQGAHTTNQIFIPRYAVELTPSGPVSITPTKRRSSSSSRGGQGTPGTLSAPSPRKRSIRSSTFGSSPSAGPTYIYQCGMCGKKFRRKKQSTRLNEHKTPGGWPCSGQTGYLIDTKY
jgi:hypothetical protein